jgi:AcrR family transcriptional regulator
MLSIRQRMVKSKETVQLGKENWIQAGLEVLTEGGIEAVRVEPLARRLKVTKGSFYWHFKNRDDLLDAILQHWIELETDGIIEEVERKGGTANQKMLYLSEIAAQEDGRSENAIRAWSRQSPHVAAILAEVDQRRLDYVQNLFLEMGFTPFESLVRARLAYHSLIGEFTLGINLNPEERLKEVRMQHEIFTRK